MGTARFLRSIGWVPRGTWPTGRADASGCVMGSLWDPNSWRIRLRCEGLADAAGYDARLLRELRGVANG